MRTCLLNFVNDAEHCRSKNLQSKQTKTKGFDADID